MTTADTIRLYLKMKVCVQILGKFSPIDEFVSEVSFQDWIYKLRFIIDQIRLYKLIENIRPLRYRIIYILGKNFSVPQIKSFAPQKIYFYLKYGIPYVFYFSPYANFGLFLFRIFTTKRVSEMVGLGVVKRKYQYIRIMFFL